MDIFSPVRNFYRNVEKELGTDQTPKFLLFLILPVLFVVLLLDNNLHFLDILPNPQASYTVTSSSDAILSPVGHSIFLPVIFSPNEPGSWPMVAANPERTSWTSEEVRGSLVPVWARPIEPYIHYKIQIITSFGKLFISTAQGLYALNSDNGNVDWIYPTDLPLGNSPTISNGIVYVGGYDRKIHALNPYTGEVTPGWTFYQAGAGYDANPLVMNGIIYVGNRDGYFYAFDAYSGSLKWKYQTGGPISFSAAYQNGVVFFASNDSYAYALNANTNNPDGQLIWKSKLPGAGFYSYWPVIYTPKNTQQSYVVFSGSEDYHNYPDLFQMDREALFPNHVTDPPGTLIATPGNVPGDWASATVTLDVSKITNYLEQNPGRRVVYLLNTETGQEYSFDSNGNGKPEYAPFNWAGTTHSGNKYPPVIGKDGVLYQFANYASNPYITKGQVSGWKFNDHYISQISPFLSAVDEPLAYAMGGNILYWGLCCDRASGASDVTIPYGQPNRSWTYFNYNLRSLVLNYQPMYYGNDMNGWGLYGNLNGIYGKHGDQNPPIPYRGKVFMQKGNTIIAFGSRGPVNFLPIALTASAPKTSTTVSTQQLTEKLETEVQKVVSDPGTFLRPGYYGTGFFDFGHTIDGDKLIDYFHNPADTLYTLTQALPYLSPGLQLQTRTYLQQFAVRFPPDQIVHVGWKDGLAREPFSIPDEVAKYYAGGPLTTVQAGTWWKYYPPDSFYGVWKYAQVFGGAKTLFDNMKSKLELPPADNYLVSKPYIHNAYIAGYIGYLELERMAGYSETSTVRATLEHLLVLRSSQFSKDSPYTVADITGGLTNVNYNRTLNLSRNFMFIVPELAEYLHNHSLPQVQEALDEYNQVGPYWFVSRLDVTPGEGVMHPLFDNHALFLARAYILHQTREELAGYLDVPAFTRGDLFYIQKLVALIQAP